MARIALLFLAVVVSLIAVSSASFGEENPIRQVVADRLRELEASFMEVVGDNRHVLSFARFALKYAKKYETAEEIKKRFEIFRENLWKIESHNKKGLSYTLGINEFSDMTWEEFRKHRLGEQQHCSATKESTLKLNNVHLPPSKDWRDAGIVSPVKDQGNCGSSWTFSATGAMEAAYALNYGKNISLSEQQLLDCAGDFNNFGCNGGLPSQAFEYIKYSGGIETAESYPYMAKEGECKFDRGNAALRVFDTFNITQGDEYVLQVCVAIVPVSVAFQVLDDFRQYKSGIYTSTECGSTPEDLNHAVLAVGYGVENDTPYWIIKNSWGAEWGDKGYFKIELGKNMCGVATCASFPALG